MIPLDTAFIMYFSICSVPWGRGSPLWWGAAHTWEIHTSIPISSNLWIPSSPSHQESSDILLPCQLCNGKGERERLCRWLQEWLLVLDLAWKVSRAAWLIMVSTVSSLYSQKTSPKNVAVSLILLLQNHLFHGEMSLSWNTGFLCDVYDRFCVSDEEAEIQQSRALALVWASLVAHSIHTLTAHLWGVRPQGLVDAKVGLESRFVESQSLSTIA